MVAEPAFWKSKSVLITGHTGFKGSWLSLWLQSLGARVIGYSLPAPTNPSLFESGRVGDAMVSIIGDVRDLSGVCSVISTHRPEIIIHMAAQPLVRYSYANPVETYETNVIGTVNVLEAVRRIGGVKVVVVVTSDKCYENREWMRGYEENDPLGGHDPYSSSKGCAELVTAAFRASYFSPQEIHKHNVAVATVRAGNVIGGGDWAMDRLIPDIVRAFLSRKLVRIRNPHAIRPWQHVLEPLSGYLMLAQNLWHAGESFSEAWNFGPTDEEAKPVAWVVDYVTRQWGEGAGWEIDGGNHSHESTYLRLDSTKARRRLGWEPCWTLAKTLESVVASYKAFARGENIKEYTLKEIGAYMGSSDVGARVNRVG